MITHAQFAEENRRIRDLKKQGWREDQIKGWLRKWREVGVRYNK